MSVIVGTAVPSQEMTETPGTMAGHGFRTRVSSFHMRELARRKVLVEISKITLLYCIGEGLKFSLSFCVYLYNVQGLFYNNNTQLIFNAGEFGIVYKATIKPSSRTVAVKTLKGEFAANCC